MTLTNWTKLLVAIVTLLCCTFLIGTGAIGSGEGLPIITLVIGYVLGNGIAAVQNKIVEPIIGRRDNGAGELGTVLAVILGVIVAVVILKVLGVSW